MRFLCFLITLFSSQFFWHYCVFLQLSSRQFILLIVLISERQLQSWTTFMSCQEPPHNSQKSLNTQPWWTLENWLCSVKQLPFWFHLLFPPGKRDFEEVGWKHTLSWRGASLQIIYQDNKEVKLPTLFLLRCILIRMKTNVSTKLSPSQNCSFDHLAVWELMKRQQLCSF